MEKENKKMSLVFMSSTCEQETFLLKKENTIRFKIYVPLKENYIKQL